MEGGDRASGGDCHWFAAYGRGPRRPGREDDCEMGLAWSNCWMDMGMELEYWATGWGYEDQLLDQPAGPVEPRPGSLEWTICLCKGASELDHGLGRIHELISLLKQIKDFVAEPF
ncbi:hypothetical protein LIER_23802 [Lithospermum erythrorhizon]|uniref:Uncharacterized protein n=1 Tax=Lithospermum erythrorhizon TaxID=34254 RepID=A0AAV3QYU7_LITER